MKIANQNLPVWFRALVVIMSALMVLWLIVLYLGSPKHFDWPFHVEINSWGLFFTSFGVLVNVFTLIFLGLTFFNQQKHHDEMMVESAFFSMLNSYGDLASNIFSAQEIPVFSRDLRYLNREEHDTAYRLFYGGRTNYNKRYQLTMRTGRSFFVDFFRYLRGGAYVYKNDLQPGISHQELFTILYENETNQNAFWPVCETIFLNFLTILEYLHVHDSPKRPFFEAVLNANISMEEMAIIYYMAHSKWHNGLNAHQQLILKDFFERYPITNRVPKAVQLGEEPLEWGSYRPS